MRRDGRDEIGPDPTHIERGLARLASAPVPSGLQGRVIDRALEARRGAALTPRLRTLAAVCGLVTAAVLVIDTLAVRRETVRLAALLDGLSPVRTAASENLELVELLGGHEREAGRISRLQAMAASAARNEQKGDLIEARARLKGWIEHETSENIN